MKKINFAKLNIKKSDLKLVNKVLMSGWLAHGEYSKKFEEEICKFTKAKYAVTVSSCTAGLHLSFLAQGLKKGDEVVVPAMTHTATAHSIEYTGARAVFCDIDYKTGNICPLSFEKKITNKTKAVAVVHMAGLAANLDKILSVCKKRNIKVIEDCAHALGTTYKNKHVGLFGLAGVFSFYPTKQITTGEGGVLISNNRAFIEKIKKLKAFGIDTPPQMRKKPGIYDIKYLGFNYRMTEFQAVLGLTQLKRYPENLKKRRSNALYLTKLIKPLKNIYSIDYDKSNSYFIFQILFKNTSLRSKAINILQKSNIGFSIHYATPVPLFSFYKKKYGYKKEQFKNSFCYSKHSLSLPINNNISKSDLNSIYNKLKLI